MSGETCRILVLTFSISTTVALQTDVGMHVFLSVPAKGLGISINNLRGHGTSRDTQFIVEVPCGWNTLGMVPVTMALVKCRCRERAASAFLSIKHEVLGLLQR